MSILSCSGKAPIKMGPSELGLAPCPSSPNCVSSDAVDEGHRVEALRLAVPPEQAWQSVRDALSKLPRTTVVEDTASYLHVECASAIFGFVDDLELELRAPEDQIAVRSASRLGYSDMGVNRKRVEALRQTLRERGAVQ